MSDQSRPASAAILSTLVMPDVGNLHGGVFGGWVLGQCDLAAGLAGRRHAGACVTKAVQEFVFHAALRVGDAFHVHAEIVREGQSSLTVELQGWREPASGAAALVVTGRFVMVCVDADGRPRMVSHRQAG